MARTTTKRRPRRRMKQKQIQLQVLAKCATHSQTFVRAHTSTYTYLYASQGLGSDDSEEKDNKPATKEGSRSDYTTVQVEKQQDQAPHHDDESSSRKSLPSRSSADGASSNTSPEQVSEHRHPHTKATPRTHSLPQSAAKAGKDVSCEFGRLLVGGRSRSAKEGGGQL